MLQALLAGDIEWGWMGKGLARKQGNKIVCPYTTDATESSKTFLGDAIPTLVIPDHRIEIVVYSLNADTQSIAIESLHDNEEAVCNWNVKKKKKHFKIRAQNYYSIARNFMLNFQPDGYKHFEKIAPRNYLKNIMEPGSSMSKEIKAALKKEFNTHSKLKMVMPLTKKMEENAAIQVPIYLIRTVKQKRREKINNDRRKIL